MEVAVFAAALVTLLFLNHRRVREAIENFNDHFRGGPPTPMHPSPAGDDRHLRRPASDRAR